MCLGVFVPSDVYVCVFDSVPTQPGVIDLLYFGCVCVCCGSVGNDCPFLCPEVT